MVPAKEGKIGDLRGFKPSPRLRIYAAPMSRKRRNGKTKTSPERANTNARRA